MGLIAESSWSEIVSLLSLGAHLGFLVLQTLFIKT